MKLYKATVEKTIVMVAENMPDAYSRAGHYSDEETGEPAIIDIEEITSISDVPKGWLKSLPWGWEDERTVEQLLTNS